MAQYFMPVIYDPDEQRLRPATAGKEIEPSSIPVSRGQDNIVTVEPDGVYAKAVSKSAGNVLITSLSDGGAYLEPRALVSQDLNNDLHLGADGKLFTTSTMSKEAGNLLRYGNDRGVFLSARDIVSVTPDNRIGLNPQDDKLYVDSPVSKDAGNALVRSATDGAAFLSPSNLVSADADNRIGVGTDGKLMTPPPVSTDAGNALVRSPTDGAAFLSPSSLVSADANNRLAVGADGKLTVGNDVGTVSTDANNLVTAGNDGGAFLATRDLISTQAENRLFASLADNRLMVAPPVSPADGNMLRLVFDGGAYLGANDLLSNEAENILGISPVDNRIILKHQDLDPQVSGDPDNLVERGGDGGVLIRADGLISADAENMVEKGTDGKLLVKREPKSAVGLINERDTILMLDADDKIRTRFSLQYNNVTGQLDFLGSTGNVVTSVSIPSSTSMLQDVQIVVDPVGYTPGTYLKFIFLLADGSVQERFIDATRFIDIYWGGIGIELINNGFNVRLEADGGLKTNNANRMVVDLPALINTEPDNSLEIRDAKLYVKPGTSYRGGIGIDLINDGFNLRLEADGGLKANNSNRMMVDLPALVSTEPENALEIRNAKLYVTQFGLRAGNGLSLVDGEVSVYPDPATHLKFTPDGKLMLDVDSLVSHSAVNLMQRTANNELLVKAVNMISTEFGNMLRTDSTGNKLYVSLLTTGGASNGSFVQNPDGSMGLKTGNGLKTAGDGTVELSLGSGLEIAPGGAVRVKVSTDLNNRLKVGSDGGLFIEQATNYGTI